MIKDNAHRLMEMIEDLEDLSSVSVDSQSAKNLVLVDDLLANMVRVTRERAEAKGIHFSAEFSEPGLQAELDPKRQSQVVKKLCSNALKYTAQGYIRLSVDVRYHNEQGEKLVITLEDSGQGMSPQKLKTLFRSVSQLYDDYVHHHRGTGLGIALIKEFVAEMEGELEVTSTEGEGTCFKIVLPRYSSTAPENSIALF